MQVAGSSSGFARNGSECDPDCCHALRSFPPLLLPSLEFLVDVQAQAATVPLLSQAVEIVVAKIVHYLPVGCRGSAISSLLRGCLALFGCCSVGRNTDE